MFENYGRQAQNARVEGKAKSIGYLSVAVMKHRTQKQLKDEGVHFGLWFQGDESPPQLEGIAVGSRHGSLVSSLRLHILNHKREPERVNWKWHQTLESQSPAPVFCQQGHTF